MDFIRMASALTLTLAGCTQLNPAFEGGDATIADGSSDTADGSSGASAESGDNSADGDGDPVGDGDGDPGGDGDGDPGGDGDGDEPPTCALEPREGMQFVVETANCIEQGNMFFRVAPDSVVNTMIEADRCTGEGCLECPEPVSFGIPGYELFPTNFDWFISVGLMNNANESTCVEVQVLSRMMDGLGGCRYASASVLDRGVAEPLLIFNRDNAPLTPMANAQLGNAIPHPGTELPGCSCADYWYGDVNNNQGCCEQLQIDPHEFKLGVAGTERAPGDDPVELPIGNYSWMFDVIQAQHIPSCDVPEPQTTWTMVRALP